MAGGGCLRRGRFCLMVSRTVRLVGTEANSQASVRVTAVPASSRHMPSLGTFPRHPDAVRRSYPSQGSPSGSSGPGVAPACGLSHWRRGNPAWSARSASGARSVVPRENLPRGNHSPRGRPAWGVSGPHALKPAANIPQAWFAPGSYPAVLGSMRALGAVRSRLQWRNRPRSRVRGRFPFGLRRIRSQETERGLSHISNQSAGNAGTRVRSSHSTGGQDFATAGWSPLPRGELESKPLVRALPPVEPNQVNANAKSSPRNVYHDMLHPIRSR